jgi:AcrR family transcriptional regulator
MRADPSVPAPRKGDSPPAAKTRGPRRRRPRQDEVLDAALHVFAAKGYRAATIDDIAGALGFRPSALYYYVESKQALLAELARRPADLLTAEAARVAALGLPPAEELSALVAGHLRLVTGNHELFVVMTREQMELAPADLAALQARSRAYYTRLQTVIERGLADGALATADAQAAALMTIGAVSWTMYWFQGGGPLSADDVGELLTGTLFQGLLPR